MPYNIPNSGDVAAIDLAEPDNSDFVALGFHRTGVISGGLVTQSGTPAMTVLVAAAEIVIDGVPYAKASAPVGLDPSTASPRFDVIGWNVLGNPVAVKGTPSSTNPVIPAVDPVEFCTAAVVYIGAGAVSITNSYIVQKQVTLHTSLRRNYTADEDVALDFVTPTKPNSFRALASGTLSWVSNVLTRTADTAMSWATSLTILQNATATPSLVLKSASAGVKGDYILQVQPSASSSVLAGIDTTGRFAGLNFRSGAGSPEGTITADRGTIYLNESPVDGNNALYVKTTDGEAVGWAALAAYVANAQAIPVGCVLMWPGVDGLDDVPVGYLFCDGHEEATAEYPALSNFCGDKFGPAAEGNFKLPDYRGRTPFGVDGVLTSVPGVNIGFSEITLSIDQMPDHGHDVVDGKHGHAQMGLYPYVVEQAYIPPYHLPNNDQSGVGINIEDASYDHTSPTGIAVTNAGGGQPLSLYQPSQSTNFIIKT